MTKPTTPEKKNAKFSEEVLRAYKILDDAIHWKPPWVLGDYAKEATRVLMNALKDEGWVIRIERGSVEEKTDAD